MHYYVVISAVRMPWTLVLSEWSSTCVLYPFPTPTVYRGRSVSLNSANPPLGRVVDMIELLVLRHRLLLRRRLILEYSSSHPEPMRACKKNPERERVEINEEKAKKKLETQNARKIASPQVLVVLVVVEKAGREAWLTDKQTDSTHMYEVYKQARETWRRKWWLLAILEKLLLLKLCANPGEVSVW